MQRTNDGIISEGYADSIILLDESEAEQVRQTNKWKRIPYWSATLSV